MTTTDAEAARIARLKATRDRLEAQLADPNTPPYSIAPLSNQLRLTDKELDRIQRRADVADDGLPTTPDRATILDFFQYDVNARQSVGRRSMNDWTRRQADIHDSWRAAGFVLPPRPPQDDRPRREALEEWADEARAELARCLETATNNEENQP